MMQVKFNVIKEMDITKRTTKVIKQMEVTYRVAEYSPSS
jgi:hypothetical protein